MNHNNLTMNGPLACDEWRVDGLHQSRRQSKTFIDHWTAAGLSKYVALPMICVLGETSSGKSSVLSSLIGLELPSGSNLTTKCPVLIQVKQGKRDEASVNIQWYQQQHQKNLHGNNESLYGVDNNRHSLRERKRSIEKQIEERLSRSLDDMKGHVDEMKDDPLTTTTTIPTRATSTTPPPSWNTRKITTDIAIQVPLLLKEAQDLILSYRSDMLIAPDVICVTLQSTTAQQELTLIDLPGLVAYQHTQESSLLSQVEEIVLEYVHNPRSILLPIVPAPTNIHNSKVLQWCRTVDPTTARTIPVLTKPDLIDPGSELDVLTLLQERQQQFTHGFYLVKNRGQALHHDGSSIATGLEDEAHFFANTTPWNNLPQQEQQRLGIPALRKTLASVLLQVMKESLPEIIDEMKDQYQQINAAIDDWGEILLTRSEQRKFYHALIQNLIANVSSNLSGKGPRGRSTSKSPQAGAATLHEACNVFLKQIKNSSLAAISQLQEGALVLVSTTNSAEDIKGEVVHIDLEGGFVCVDFVDKNDHSTDVLFDAVGYTSDHPDFEKDEVWSDGSRIFVGRESGTFDSLRKIPLNHVRTDPSWLIEKIAEFRTDDLACFINVELFRNIVGEFVHIDWTPPCMELLKTLKTILNRALDQALQLSFQDVSRYPLLKNMMEESCHEACKKLLDAAMEDVKAHLEIEENHPYTQDEVLLQTLSESRFRNLRHDLDIQLKLAQEGVVFDTQAITTILDTVFNKHKKLHWMAEQMELVLSSYGQVATQRVLDRTPQICWQTCRKLPSALHEALGSVTDDILEKCLWESPENKAEYENMVSKQKELREAMEMVKSIQ